MLNSKNSIDLSEQNQVTFLENASLRCKKLLEENFEHLEICDYIYCSDEAVEELGLDAELISEFVEDYIEQVLESKALFLEYITKLQDDKKQNRELDYTLLRELAHKNLGVARNLRIKSAEKLLNELMRKEDLDYLQICLEALAVCTILINPKYVYTRLTNSVNR